MTAKAVAKVPKTISHQPKGDVVLDIKQPIINAIENLGFMKTNKTKTSDILNWTDPKLNGDKAQVNATYKAAIIADSAKNFILILYIFFTLFLYNNHYEIILSLFKQNKRPRGGLLQKIGRVIVCLWKKIM